MPWNQAWGHLDGKLQGPKGGHKLQLGTSLGLEDSSSHASEEFWNHGRQGCKSIIIIFFLCGINTHFLECLEFLGNQRGDAWPEKGRSTAL